MNTRQKTGFFFALFFLGFSSVLHAQLSVYFNNSIDSTLALPGNVAAGDQDFAEIALSHISQASHSIDMAMYNLSVQSIVDGLIAAKNRGVKVRVIGHVGNIDNVHFEQLRREGIPVHSNPKAPAGERQGLMHNKFFLIDARSHEVIDVLPRLITGSWNATVNQTWTDPNNVVVIQPEDWAAGTTMMIHIYLEEFEQMWGSSGDLPDPATARFGNAKQGYGGRNYMLDDGTQIEVWFSPSDKTSSHIADVLETGQTSIYTANLTFTYNDLSTALRNQVNQYDADVRCIIDNVNDLGSDYNFLRDFAEAFDWQNGNIFHHKYGIVDPVPIGTGSMPTVITGSHNWTNSAENFNDENTLIIYSEKIANQFLQEFSARYEEVGGMEPFSFGDTTNSVKVEEDRGKSWLWPNPASSYLVAQTEEGEEIILKDIVGRTIDVEQTFDGKGTRLSLEDLPEGSYFLLSSHGKREQVQILR